jgi:hypothetical protein
LTSTGKTERETRWARCANSDNDESSDILNPCEFVGFVDFARHPTCPDCKRATLVLEDAPPRSVSRETLEPRRAETPMDLARIIVARKIGGPATDNAFAVAKLLRDWRIAILRRLRHDISSQPQGGYDVFDVIEMEIDKWREDGLSSTVEELRLAHERVDQLEKRERYLEQELDKARGDLAAERGH